MEQPFLPPKLSKAYFHEFDGWLWAKLENFAKPMIENGQEHLWRVVAGFLAESGDGWGNLTNDELRQLKATIFEVGVQTSYMVGIGIPRDIDKGLADWGWSAKEIRNFPGWAYRIALIRFLIISKRIQRFSELLGAALSHPLSEADREAIEFARNEGFKNLKPIYDAAGRLVEGESLEEEKERLRPLLIAAIIESKSPLSLARKMFLEEKAAGIFRDFERVARTELANCFHHGQFRADRIAGKFAESDFVFRIPRPQACKLCLSLYVEPSGTPRLYKLKDLLEETTDAGRISGRGKKLYRASIGVSHPNCLCSSWQKYWGEISDQMFQPSASSYMEARARYRL